MTVHWCGTGLSAIPGLRRLIQGGNDVCVWNRTVEKARSALHDLDVEIQPTDKTQIKARLKPGDVLVSMLPGDWHVPLAETALDAGAHFVSSSYISPEMRALEPRAKTADVALVNEIGLDPGIDHLMAHWLVADYMASEAFDPAHDLSFRSYCGGIPKVANDFCYKFSWSPLGVLKALRSPSRSLKDHRIHDVDRPWQAVTSYTAPLRAEESFEVYPNRDSLPFMADYGFDPAWKVKDFVRGTLRLNGWTKAWSEIFEMIESHAGSDTIDAELEALSGKLWDRYTYAEGEADRVVLCVELLAAQADKPVYHKTYALDAWGDARGSAMARLVSIPVSLAVDAVLSGKISSGVHAATNDPDLVRHMLDHVRANAQHMQIIDFVT